jgi:hypothetical protein
MKKEAIFFFMIVMVISWNTYAQQDDLYVPLEIKNAYESGTRSYSGGPGDGYFQNKAHYRINARFDPETGILSGEEEILYQNNSPDTIKHLVLRVYMNFFSKGAPRDFYIGSSDLHNGVSINDMRVNGKQISRAGGPQLIDDRGTVYRIELLDPLLPDHDAKISLSWKVQLPQQVAIRMGKYGNGNNWFVGYWYPQISVYDDISGWDIHPFTGSAEFYNDFNDYDVKLTLPGKYMVWATGILQNPGKLYQKQILDRIGKAEQSEDVIAIISTEDISENRVLKKGKTHTWHFIAEDVPDFAFATSKSYIWDATSIRAEAENGRRTLISAVYEAGAAYFDRVAAIGRQTIKLLNEGVMGVAFPYPRLTVFNGGGGMEFPMMVNDGEVPGYKETVHLTAHEIGHSYFPFLAMTNESYYAFMDEGLITFLPRLAEKEIIEQYDPFPSLMRQYERQAGNMREVPLMVRSYLINDYTTYRLHAYQRPAVAFYFLRNFLGADAFHRNLKAFIRKWAYKHPTPYDFFFTFENMANRDLTWFWKPWFFEFGYPDLAIQKFDQQDKGAMVHIENKGQLPLPVYLKVTFANGETTIYEESMDIWEEASGHIEVTIDEEKEIDIVVLGNKYIPDVYRGDNIWRR